MFDKIAEKEDIMKYVVDTHGLTKIFGKHRAVDCVSLHIKRGEIYGFIGKNGAGKTTFMKMVSGLSAPTSGEIALFGVSGREAEKYHSRIGNLIEQPGLYEGMSAKENLHLKCLALGIHEKGYEEKLLGDVGLRDAKKKKVKQFSLGMKQRLGIAMALAGRPDLLILDEPVNGLDPQGIAEIRDLLLKLKFEKNMTILISSHILEELYKVADTFGVIHKGVLIQELSKEELDQKCRDYTEIKTGDTEKACPVIEELGYHNYKVITADCIHLYDRVAEIGKLNMELAKQGCMVESLQVVQDKLEEYFLELTRD
jgi:ABC-type multidrug transport system, ATPase component